VNDNSRIDLSKFLSIVRQRWLAIVASASLAAALALGFSLAQPDSYKASADLLFQKDDLDSTVFGSTGQDNQPAPERVAATNLALASLQVVAQGVKRNLRTRLSVQQLQDRISIAPKGQADIVTITATGPTPRSAALVANAFANEVEAFRRRDAQEKVQRAIDALELSQQSSTQTDTGGGITPAQRLEQLHAIKALQQGDVTVVQRAEPQDHRAAPKPVRNTIAGGLLGLILGVFLALLLQRLDRRVRDDEELVKIVGVPVLSRVPVSERSSGRDAFEALQFLRANLQLQDPQRETRVIVVTSPMAAEGKTTIAAGLAEALALSGEKVVAIDCDLRQPMLHEQLEVERGPGVTEALVELRNVEELLVEASPGLRVLTAGSMPLDPFLIVSALLRLPELLTELRALADYVIIDTPPVSAAADASSVASMADGVLLIVDAARGRRDSLAAAHEQLVHARARLLGVVVNRATAPGFGNEYGSYRAPEGKIAVP
jgi:polysaccharide biosynthesis transport protein